MGAAARSCSNNAKDAELWLQVVCKDLAEVKFAVARRIILPSCKCWGGAPVLTVPELVFAKAGPFVPGTSS